MAAAAIWATNVVLTDLEEIQDNLLFNVERNMSAVEVLGGGMSGGILDWTKPVEALTSLPSRDFEVFKSLSLTLFPLTNSDHYSCRSDVRQRTPRPRG